MMAVSPSAPNFPASSVGGDASTADMPNTKTSETASSGGGADDAASLLSSSSRSARFFKASPAPPTLTTGSGTEPAASDMRSRTGSIRSRGRADSSQLGQGRARRTSEAAAGNPVGENEAAPSLDPALELEIQGSGREGGKWGIGDEARMGLE